MSLALMMWLVAAMDIDVPAGPAPETILQWSRQVHLSVLFELEPVAQWKSVAVKGRMTPLEALRAMLSQTDLQADYTTPTAVAVFELPRYCHPEWGASAPLPPCVQKPMIIGGTRL